jgi:hypothetical protein
MMQSIVLGSTYAMQAPHGGTSALVHVMHAAGGAAMQPAPPRSQLALLTQLGEYLSSVLARIQELEVALEKATMELTAAAEERARLVSTNQSLARRDRKLA